MPEQEIRIEDELEYYGNSLKKAMRAKNMIGIDRRRLAYPGQAASDLCQVAAENLLADYPDVRDKIDALIFVSQSPDYVLPATACILQDKMNLPQSCAAFDVNQGCAGFVYGLWIAASMLNSGCRNVLMLTGDAPGRPRNTANRIISSIFGDGGTATLLAANSEAPEMSFAIGTDGSGFEHIIVPAGYVRLVVSKNLEENRVLVEDIIDPSGVPWNLCETYMDGHAVFEFTMRVVPSHIQEFLAKNNLTPDDVDYFMLHQANKQIVTEIAKKAGMPVEKTPCQSFSKYGNLSSASIPVALCDFFGDAGSSGKATILCCGYGVGLSWASCLWYADNCDIKPVISVPDPHNPTSEQQIERWRKKITGEENAGK